MWEFATKIRQEANRFEEYCNDTNGEVDKDITRGYLEELKAFK